MFPNFSGIIALLQPENARFALFPSGLGTFKSSRTRFYFRGQQRYVYLHSSSV